MNNLNGYCRRSEVLQAEGKTEDVARLFQVSEPDLVKTLGEVYSAMVADKFFQHFLGKPILQASDSEFDTVLASDVAYAEWNKTSFTFDQVTSAIKLIRSRL